MVVLEPADLAVSWLTDDATDGYYVAHVPTFGGPVFEDQSGYVAGRWGAAAYAGWKVVSAWAARCLPALARKVPRLVDDAVGIADDAIRGSTNTRPLSLPFKDDALSSQIDDVVRHFDELGTPPSGVAQGGLRGQPVGVYGGQGLPQQPLGYYTESDVFISGGGIKRTAERLVFGQGGEVWYSPNHYENFIRIR